MELLLASAEQFQLPAHQIEGRSHGQVVRVEPFGSDRFAFVVIHAGLDAVRSRSVPRRATAGHSFRQIGPFAEATQEAQRQRVRLHRTGLPGGRAEAHRGAVLTVDAGASAPAHRPRRYETFLCQE
jgi:hypothetical protein